MNNQGSIMVWIERKLLKPAYVMMLFGLMVRGIALVLSGSIPYERWPLWMQLGIEGIAAFAMVGCADLILGTSTRLHVQIKKQAQGIRTSDAYIPRAGLSTKRYEVERERLRRAQEQAIRALEEEAKPYWFAMLACATITIVYGVSFAVTTLHGQNWGIAMIEIIGVGSIPFFTYFIAGYHREVKESPSDHAESIATEAVNDRLVAAQGRFATGEETPGDVALVRVGVAASPYHVSLVKAISQKVDGIKYWSARELYDLLGAITPSDQASIRRLIRTAGTAEKHGVVLDEEGRSYVVPDQAIPHLFARYLNKVAALRTFSDTSRTNLPTGAALVPVSLEHSANSARTTNV